MAAGPATPPQTEEPGNNAVVASTPLPTDKPAHEVPQSDRSRQFHLIEAKCARLQAEVVELKAENAVLRQQNEAASHQAIEARQAQATLSCHATSCEAKCCGLEKEVSLLRAKLHELMNGTQDLAKRTAELQQSKERMERNYQHAQPAAGSPHEGGGGAQARGQGYVKDTLQVSA